MENDETISSHVIKKPSRRRYVFAAVLVVLLISVLVFIWFTQEFQSDDVSEKIIRQVVANQLHKDVNELNDEDYKKIISFSIPNPVTDKRYTLVRSDIQILEKFTNLHELNLTFQPLFKKNIPKWMKILTKFGIYDIDERFSINLSPLKNLTSLTKLRLSGTRISDIKQLKKLINLEELSIDYTLVSDLKPLEGLMNIQSLNISLTPVSSLETIKHLKKLRRLIIINCTKITDEQLKDLKTACPGLVVITNWVQEMEYIENSISGNK
jgi:hypothetical protein